MRDLVSPTAGVDLRGNALSAEERLELLDAADGVEGAHQQQLGSVFALGTGKGLRREVEAAVRAAFESEVLLVVAVVSEHKGARVALHTQICVGLLDQAVFREEHRLALGQHEALVALGATFRVQVALAVRNRVLDRFAGFDRHFSAVGAAAQAKLARDAVVVLAIRNGLGLEANPVLQEKAVVAELALHGQRVHGCAVRNGGFEAGSGRRDEEKVGLALQTGQFFG